MARLKVKQISDFTTAVQTLIDNDVDQNAGDISSALSAGVSAGVNADGVQTNLNTVSDALSVEVSSTNSDVVRIDALLASAAGGADVTAVSNALTTEIAATNSDVTRIDAVIASAADAADVTAVSNALVTEIAATNSDVTRIDGLLASVATDGELSTEVASIDTRISNEESTRSADVKAVSDAVVAILDGSTTNLDQFAEVISYVDSLDTADGGALTSQIASLEGVVSANSSSDVVLSTALSTEVSATNSDVLSIETVLGTMGTSETITAISTSLSTEISTTNSEIVVIDASIDALEAQMLSVATDAELGTISTALSAEIVATDADVASLATLIGTADDMAHEFGTFRGVTSFSIANAVQFQGTDDLLVFVNGHNIHPFTGSEETGVGYQTPDGLTFNFTNIGYDLEATDTFYVTGKKA